MDGVQWIFARYLGFLALGALGLVAVVAAIIFGVWVL